MHTTFCHSVKGTSLTYSKTFTSVFTFSNAKKEFFMCLLYIFNFKKDLENQDISGLSPDFWPEVPGFVLGSCFGSCFTKFELPGFVLVPVLKQDRTS